MKQKRTASVDAGSCPKKSTSILGKLLNICPYTHIWHVIKTSIKERKFSATSRQGVFIALLGTCCPLFWIALFTGVRGAELKMHALHSGAFVLIGVAMIITGLVKK